MPKMVLYVTKGKPYLTRETDLVGYNKYYLFEDDYGCENGKVVAEFDFTIENIESKALNRDKTVYDYFHSGIRVQDDEEWLKSTGLIMSELDDYLKGKNGKVIHISNLNIYFNSKKLADFRKKLTFKLKGKPKEDTLSSIVYPPQNMLRVVDYDGNEYFLISLKAKESCNILNGVQTAIVRKIILEEMEK